VSENNIELVKVIIENLEEKKPRVPLLSSLMKSYPHMDPEYFKTNYNLENSILNSTDLNSVARKFDNDEMIRLLLDFRIESDERVALFDFVKEGHLEKIENLLSNYKAQDPFGWVLEAAVENANAKTLEIVKMLIHGAKDHTDGP
jgi:hypothetical protein